MPSINAIQNPIFKDITNPPAVKKPIPQQSPQAPKPDIFENNSKNTESKIKKAYKYLTAPIENPAYKRGAYGAKATTTRLQKYLGYALLACFYGFLFLYMIKTLKMTGVTVKPESANSFMNKYKENLYRAPKLEDLALPDKLEKAVNRLMNRIQNPQSFIDKGGVANNHILLYGPPGTGKTTVAKAIARGINNAELYSVDLSTIQGKFVGESEANLDKIIKNICKYADENPAKKIVVLMDEFDSVAIKDNGSTNQQYHASLLNVLKRAMSEKLASHDNVILIATTNAELEKTHGTEWVQKLDSAIADRFGEQIRVDNPTKEQFCKAIAKHYKSAKKAQEVLKDESSEEVNKIAQKLADKKCSFRTLNRLFKNSAETEEEILSAKGVMNALEALIQSTKNNTQKEIAIKGFTID